MATKTLALYKLDETDAEIEEALPILEDLRQQIAAAGIGVTLVGNRLTTRWYHNGVLVDAHMIIAHITTEEE
jgi:hypothetical protein